VGWGGLGGGRTGWHGGRATLDELVVGWAEGLREVGDGGEALGVDGREAKGWAPDVELEDHGGSATLSDFLHEVRVEHNVRWVIRCLDRCDSIRLQARTCFRGCTSSRGDNAARYARVGKFPERR
jgi:hypothetical protein